MSQWKKPFIFVKNFYLFLGMRFLMCVAGKGSRLECFAFVFRLGITHLVYDKKFFESRKVGKLTTIKPRKNWISAKNLLPQKRYHESSHNWVGTKLWWFTAINSKSQRVEKTEVKLFKLEDQFHPWVHSSGGSIDEIFFLAKIHCAWCGCFLL